MLVPHLPAQAVQLRRGLLQKGRVRALVPDKRLFFHLCLGDLAAQLRGLPLQGVVPAGRLPQIGRAGLGRLGFLLRDALAQGGGALAVLQCGDRAGELHLARHKTGDRCGVCFRR